MKGKPYTIYSDNPKMNTAPYKKPEMVLIDLPGFAMGGLVSPKLRRTEKDRLVERAMMDEEMRAMETEAERRQRKK